MAAAGGGPPPAASPARYPDLLARLAAARPLGVDLGLERVRDALARLGDPQRRFAAIQIAGTNGKGSTAAMAEAILRGAGLRTGLYTSPHLARFTERIRIAGVEAGGDRLAEIDRRVAATGVPLTYFEIATVLALVAMAEGEVEVAVLETGLGGRLDAVTAVDPIATAITTIGFDHMAYLGDTLREIAREKAGIIKEGVPCFVGRLPGEADEEIAAVAAARKAPLFRLGRDFAPPEAAPGLAGTHQRGNAAIAVSLAKACARPLGRSFSDEEIARALAGVSWPGRLERVGDDLLFDCAHNPEGAGALARALPEIAAGRRIVAVVSIVDDKDAATILSPLARAVPALVATQSANPRARPAAALATAARPFFSEVETREEPAAALAEARRLAGPGGLVLVYGSIFLVGPLRARVLGEPTDPAPTSDPL